MLRLGSSPVFLACATLSVLSGCTFLLDFDAAVTGSDASIDGGTLDGKAFDALQDAQRAVYCEVAEPNDDNGTARVLEEGALSAALCTDAVDDLDYYSFLVATDTDLVLSLTFDDSIASLILTLYDSSDTTTPIIESLGTNSPAEIERVLAQSSQLTTGTYQVKISSMSPTNLDYTLTLDRSPDPL